MPLRALPFVSALYYAVDKTFPRRYNLNVKINKARYNMLEKGNKAPYFTLSDADGRQYSLADFAGKPLVLYFYPKDNTPGCTRQACAFGALYGQFRALGAEVVGVSKDSAASHAKFREKFSLPFILLSDPDRTVHEAYGAMGEKKLYGKVTYGTVRTTYIIGADGTVIYAKAGVSPDKNPQEVLDFLKTLEN